MNSALHPASSHARVYGCMSSSKYLCVSVCAAGFSSADLHSVPDPDPTRNVSQRLDRHAVGHQQVRQKKPYKD